jgi:ABC-type nitrate/sulfonate/bicarbonate transport system permease component
MTFSLPRFSLRRIAVAIGVAIAIFAIWCGIAFALWGRDYQLPPPSAGVLAAARLQAQADQAQAVCDTAQRVQEDKTPDQLRDEHAARAIPLHKVFIGMTQAQALASWGDPDRISSSTSVLGRYQDWFYGQSRSLYFINGSLQVIDN